MQSQQYRFHLLITSQPEEELAHEEMKIFPIACKDPDKMVRS